MKSVSTSKQSNTSLPSELKAMCQRLKFCLLHRASAELKNREPNAPSCLGVAHPPCTRVVTLGSTINIEFVPLLRWDGPANLVRSALVGDSQNNGLLWAKFCDVASSWSDVPVLRYLILEDASFIHFYNNQRWMANSTHSQKFIVSWKAREGSLLKNFRNLLRFYTTWKHG